MERVSVIGSLKRQRFAVCNLPVVTDRMNQFGQSELPVSERFSAAVFHDPAFKINGPGVTVSSSKVGYWGSG